MSTDSKMEAPPMYVVTSPAPSVETAAAAGSSAKSGKTKRLALLSITAIVIVAAVIRAILISVYMITESQADIVKFSLQFKSSDNQNANQSVESDPNSNVVTYHVTKPGQDIYVVNDFNKGMQTVRVQSISATNCYVSALNASTSMDPTQIAGADFTSGSPSEAPIGQMFVLSDKPVADRSFLTQKAQDLCSGVSVYWAYRSCGGQQVDASQFNISLTHGRSKRRAYPPMYLPSPWPGLQCLAGCCSLICACTVTITQILLTPWGLYCQFYYTTGQQACSNNLVYYARIC